MRVSRLTGPDRRSRSGVCCCFLLALWPASATTAQPIRVDPPSTVPVELTPPRIAVVSGPTAARLAQAQALAENENWSDAIEIYRQFAGAISDRLVAVEKRRYVSLRTYCHLQLARLPAAGLAEYRRLVNPLAEQLYRDGIAERDEAALRRVVDEFFCSSSADDALFALGELALERGDYAAARRCWLQISPLLRSPDGRTAWIALHGIDLASHWPEIERRWSTRAQPPHWLAYPDTELDLADVRARLALISIRANQFERAALELDLLRRFHPDAAGRFGGQRETYVAALERLLIAAREWPPATHERGWPTFAGSPSRSSAAPALGPSLAPAWPAALSLNREPPPPAARHSIARDFAEKAQGVHDSHLGIRELRQPLSSFPVVVGETVLFADDVGVRAVDLATGQPAITATGLIYANETPDDPRRESQLADLPRAVHGASRYSVSVDGDVVYYRAGRHATTPLVPGDAPADRIVGLDLSRDGILSFSRRPPGNGWSFDGVPIGDGRRLFVALRHSDVAAHAHLASYDAASGAQRWRTLIGAADTPTAGRGDETSHSLPTLVGGRVFLNTNLGIVAALDAEDGCIDWIFRYDRARRASLTSTFDAAHFGRDPSPCLYHDGLIVVAPSDAPTVFALDAHTGQLVWATDELPEALHLLGVVGQHLVLGGYRLHVVDVRSGAARFTWPDSEYAGIRGVGRGLVAGEEIFWPTRDTLYVLHALSGERTRSPISLSVVGEQGANLAAAHGYLILAGYDHLIALGPQH